MTKNRRQKKNEQQTCSAMEIIAGFLLLAGFAAQLSALAANLPVPGWAAQRCFCFRQDY